MTTQDPSFETIWGPDPYDDPSQVYGPIIGAHDIELALVGMLRKWEKDYTHVVCLKTGYASDLLPRIKSWRATSEVENYYEDHHPAVVVKCLDAVVVRRGGGQTSHQQTWRWAFEVVTQSVTRSGRNTRDKAIPQPRHVAMIYCTAFRGILVQQRDDSKILGMIDVTGERYSSTPAQAERSVHLASVIATVEVPRVVEWGRGPAEPLFPPSQPTDPPPTEEPTWPESAEVDTNIQKIPQDGSLLDDDPTNEV